MKWALLVWTVFNAMLLCGTLVMKDQDASDRAVYLVLVVINSIVAYWLYMNSGLFG